MSVCFFFDNPPCPLLIAAGVTDSGKEYTLKCLVWSLCLVVSVLNLFTRDLETLKRHGVSLLLKVALPPHKQNKTRLQNGPLSNA